MYDDENEQTTSSHAITYSSILFLLEAVGFRSEMTQILFVHCRRDLSFPTQLEGENQKQRIMDAASDFFNVSRS